MQIDEIVKIQTENLKEDIKEIKENIKDLTRKIENVIKLEERTRKIEEALREHKQNHWKAVGTIAAISSILTGIIIKLLR